MNVVIYARYSCSNQREESIEGQLKVCHEFAQRNNYTVIGEYIDRAISGKTDKRPNFLRLIDDSRHRQFEKVLVYKFDRFSRDKYDTAIYKKELKKNNVKVISACENIPDDENGIILETMLEGMAQYYSADLSRKVIRGMNSNATKCISNGGTIPLGFYIGEDRKYHINQETAPIVVKIFEMYANGSTIKEIVDFLNARNYKTVRGNEFNKNSLSKMLTNKKYIGYYVYNGQEIENGIPQIVENSLFEKCQIIMHKNKKAPARKKAKEEYLLTTKLFCGKCNSEMVGISGTGKNGNKYCYYRCKNSHLKLCDKKSVPKYDIEDIVIRETQKILTDTNITKIAKEVVRLCQKSNSHNILSILTKQLNQNKKETENLLKVIEVGNISNLILERIEAKKKERDDIEKQIRVEKMKTPTITYDKVEKFLKHFRNGEINDIKFKKSLINVFINKIIVYENKITILYNLQDSYSDILYNTVMVSQKGFEPLTPGLEGLCSIQLSY